MNCDDAARLLDAHFDGELDVARTLDFEQHLSSCNQCRARVAECGELRSMLQHRGLYWQAPQHVVAAVRASVERPHRARRLVLAGLAAAASVAVICGVLIDGRTPDDTLVKEVLSSHIRSLMASHLTDVGSSDQHTVKPWFVGRLDFAPSVRDLAAAGYPLAGGRLDYIGGRTVAALVYTRGQHRINLFVWPSEAGDAAPRELTRNGYNVIHWRRSHMSNWAVSDLNSGDLASFAALVDKGPAISGAELFAKRCGGCHSLDKNKEGPRLGGVYGRVAGKVDGFTYSDGLKSARFRWDDESLNRWLTNPDDVVKDNDMAFRLGNAAEREAVIGYLKSVSTR